MSKLMFSVLLITTIIFSVYSLQKTNFLLNKHYNSNKLTTLSNKNTIIWNPSNLIHSNSVYYYFNILLYYKLFMFYNILF